MPPRRAPASPEMAEESIETQLALIRAELREIHKHLCGNGEEGLIQQVKDLAEIADRGRWSLKLALWFGGGILAVATALAQFKQALTALFRP
jgi:hypothetical protein